MRCHSCNSPDLFPSKSHPILLRLALLVLLLHKFRCQDCYKSQIDWLPRYWFKLLRKSPKTDIEKSQEQPKTTHSPKK